MDNNEECNNGLEDETTEELLRGSQRKEQPARLFSVQYC